MPLELRFYQTAAGSQPLRHWLDGLPDTQAATRIEERLARLAAGNLGDWRPVGEGVLELRIDYGPGYRVYFARLGRLVVLLLCGGDKTTQDEDIKRAKDFFKDYKARTAPKGRRRAR